MIGAYERHTQLIHVRHSARRRLGFIIERALPTEAIKREVVNQVNSDATLEVDAQLAQGDSEDALPGTKEGAAPQKRFASLSLIDENGDLDANFWNSPPMPIKNKASIGIDCKYDRELCSFVYRENFNLGLTSRYARLLFAKCMKKYGHTGSVLGHCRWLKKSMPDNI